MTTKSYILKQCKLPKQININILKTYVKQDIDGNKEYFDDTNATYKISDPKKSEWIVHKAIPNSKMVGNGSKCIDVQLDETLGIDVSVLTLNNGTYTNEKSILQNFTNCGSLDVLFNTKKGNEAVNIFKNKLIEKYSQCLFDIYYLIFICHHTNIYITCFKWNLNKIKNMTFSSFTKTCKNITIKNFINSALGIVKLYKSKKRLELRLTKKIINTQYCIKIY